MVTLLNVFEAEQRIRPYVSPTPFEYSRILSQEYQANLYLKIESFRELRSFKVRGAMNFMQTHLDQAKQTGVVASSGGSHALGVAFAANKLGINATIVMTERAPKNLVTMVESYGANVIVKGAVYNDASKVAHEIETRENRLYIDSFNDPAIIAGQGTIGLEMLRDVPDLDLILVPVGGGGLLAGVSMVAKTVNPNIQVIGLEPTQAAAMTESLNQDQLIELADPGSIADKLVVKQVGDLTLRMAKQYVDHMVTLTEDEIKKAMFTFHEKASLLIEGAAAVPLAAIQSQKVDVKGKKVGLILTGGNVSPNTFSQVLKEYTSNS